jgi:hypothetical protein
MLPLAPCLGGAPVASCFTSQAPGLHTVFVDSENLLERGSRTALGWVGYPGRVWA